MRMFVALPLPEPVRASLATLCFGLPGARWVRPDSFHITLRFLGELDGGAAEDVDALLDGIRAPEFEVEIADVGCFSNGRTVRVVWAGVKPSAALSHLHDKVESAVVRAGLPADGHRFVPHVTLTRPKGITLDNVRQYLESHSLYRAPTFDATHFALYRSFTGSEGPIYRVEGEYDLSVA